MKTTAGTVMDFLESIAPLDRQEPYDNSGLIVGSADQAVTGVMTCLDCTEDVLDEAISKGCNMIVAHHPPVFSGLKRITGATPTERVVIKAIRHHLVLYAIHTNLDNTLAHGVNERIARRLGLDIDGVLRPMAGSSDPGTGAGLVGYFSQPMTETEFLAHLRIAMRTPVVRHTPLTDRKIKRVAVCGGSGSFLLPDALRSGVEAFVTADFKYHQFFDADGRILVCDIGHYESEQFTIGLLQELISRNFTNFAAHCTEMDTNPVRYHY